MESNFHKQESRSLNLKLENAALKIKKLLFPGLALFLFLSLGASWRCYGDQTIVENHYIPQGYEGIVTIFYPDSGNNGKGPALREFIIPANGILKTKLPFNEEFANLHFYSTDEHSNKVELKFNLDSKQIDTLSKDRQIFYLQSGVSTANNSNKDYVYLRYIVSTYKNLDSLAQIFYRQHPASMY